MTHMKLAVSIPEELYKVTGAIARRLGISRAQVYERALADFAKREDNQILIALNKMHGEETRHEINPIIRAAAERILFEELGPSLEAVGAEAMPSPAPSASRSSAHPAEKT